MSFRSRKLLSINANALICSPIAVYVKCTENTVHDYNYVALDYYNILIEYPYIYINVLFLQKLNWNR